ncbi:MAG: hypothetical protein ABSC76_10165 [Terracidiphilus sp.]|jgi:hypothetical protein
MHTNRLTLRLPSSCRFALCAALLCLTAEISAQTSAAPSAQPPAAPTTQTAEWKTLSYPTDGFSASFPSEPEMQKKDVPTAAGTFELRAYIVQQGEAAIFVGVCDYGAAAAGRTPDALLDGAQEGAISNVSGHLISGKKITLGTYPGREFEAESDTMHFSARIYLVGTTLYQTLTAAPLGQPFAGATRFLDSFQLIARVAK